MGTSSTSNGIGTASDVFEIFDVGLYADLDSTGLAPRFELPNYDDDLRECTRYFCTKGYAVDFAASGGEIQVHAFNHPMRAIPSRAITVSLTSNVSAYIWQEPAAVPHLGSVQVLAAGTGRTYSYGYVTFNARM